MGSQARSSWRILVSLLASSTVVQAALSPLSYGAFTQTATYTVANQLGFFTEFGLDVTYNQIPNSTAGYASLLDGTYDILTGTIDNAVNLRFNSKQNVTVIGQLDLGPDLVVAAVPNITSPLDLRGKSIMVDAPTSGYVFVLRRILGMYGLQLGTDYSLQVVGSTPNRFSALAAGHLPNGTEVFATVLTYPFTAMLLDLPLATRPHILARVSDFVAPFSSTALTIRSGSLDPATPEYPKILNFTRAMQRANAFLADGRNAPNVTDAIVAQLNVSTGTAMGELAAARDPASGETSQVAFNVSGVGLWNVIAIRQQFGGFEGAGSEFNFFDGVNGLNGLVDIGIRNNAAVMDLDGDVH